MAQDKYISVNKHVSGFSFANLGLFTGFADGIYNAVYSLVLLEIFRSSAVVGLYVALYSVFCFVVGLFANEILRQFSKVRVFYFVMLMLAVCYAMMSFSIRPRTFIILDYTTGIAITLVGGLMPWFMSDFQEYRYGATKFAIPFVVECWGVVCTDGGGGNRKCIWKSGGVLCVCGDLFVGVGGI